MLRSTSFAYKMVINTLYIVYSSQAFFLLFVLERKRTLRSQLRERRR